ncbi:hypothetical protein C8J57DRAFT_1082341 [Mycena rebaudengoi]|nr:hypothetical protein C8J57DRAFT_1082341 [Mycena rebaudengoi]
MVARSRATRITQLFRKAGKNSNAGSQGYSQANVAIFAQDVEAVHTVLPPPRSETQEAMCAVFYGASTVPDKDNIRKLAPILISKMAVQTMIDSSLRLSWPYV